MNGRNWLRRQGRAGMCVVAIFSFVVSLRSFRVPSSAVWEADVITSPRLRRR